MLPTGARTDLTPPADAAAPVGQGFTVTPSDLAFILKQIKISERHSRALIPELDPGNAIPNNPNPTTDPVYCQSMVGTGPDQIPSALISFGLRTVRGDCNNLMPGQSHYGAADTVFPRHTTPAFKAGESAPPGFPPASPGGYTSKRGFVYDSEPRVISNLIVDQTANNPAAVAAAGFPVRSQGNEGVVPCTSDPAPGDDDGTPDGCVPSNETLFIPNITTDVGLSPPFNSLFTIFGQFFDHGVDFTSKGKSGTVFVPLKADDPLILNGPDGIPANGDEVSPSSAFMVLTRATNQPGPDGITGDLPQTLAIDESADDIHDATNRDSPFVDQSQTYTSHSSHQIFLREFVDNTAGQPVATGKLISLPDGGQAPWSLVKQQAADSLGIQLVDTDLFNIPMLYADPYGNFIPGPARGLPQFMLNNGTLLEANRAGGGTLVPANALRIDTAFLDDIAHNAVPDTFDADNNPATPPVQKTPDADSDVGPTGTGAGAPAPGQYDDELLDAHFLSGDGRLNENIALTAVHQIFHSEHDRLVEEIKDTLRTDTSGITHLTDWQTPTGAADANGVWNGPRLFQAARFVTEMEYQHLVFEDFARKIQPLINPFEPFAFNQTDTNASVRAEFAHAVYRFGHSMLNETIPRVNAAGTHDDISLLDGFLNPAEYHVGPGNTAISSEEAATNIIMGLSDQAGNEIDEFVTNTLRNNLLGLPLDLASINMTRARSEGIPPLNEVRRQIFAETNDGSMQPYENWVDFGIGLKHPESLTNFVAAYGQHPTIRFATGGGDNDFATEGDNTAPTLASRREAARVIISQDPLDLPNRPADADDFLGATGTWASTETGINGVDLWIGGLAERTNVFGGHLGNTFNYVFEEQLTDLQNGDRLYYLARTPGMNLRTQLEGNSFAELVMRNSNAHTLKADAFATADCKFELSRLVSPAAPGSRNIGPTSIEDDLLTDCDENAVLIRMPNGQIRYREINLDDPPGINAQSVFNGTAGGDRIQAGNDSDTLLGNEGNDTLEGGDGADVALGGDGDDIITDVAGDDVPKGGPGNDAIDGGPGLDIIMAGTGNDFTNGGANINETFAGAGNDFVIGGQSLDAVFGDSGDDWIEGGAQPDLLQGDSGNLFFKDTGNVPGNDVQIGQGGDDDYDHEGGDDIGLAGPGIEKIAGGAGYDWQIGLGENAPQNQDLNLSLAGVDALVIDVRDKYNEVEALSGWKFDDILKGDDVVPSAVGGGGFVGCDALDPAGVARIAGLNALVSTFPSPLQPILDATSVGICPLVGQGAGPGNAGNVWGEGNLLLGGSGSDILEGRGANDILDGDRYVNVRISVRAGVDANGNATGAEIGSTDLMEHPFQVGNPMTLQQAVFARVVNPGQLVIVREILNDAAPSDVDVAQFSGARSEYLITRTGSIVTVDHQGGVDGVDTVHNVETLRFCNGVDANGVCNVFDDVPVSAIGPATPATAVVTPAGTVGFGIVTVGTVAQRTVTVTNNGGATLTVTGATVTGAQAGQFPILSNNCTTVGAGGSCTIDLTFSPTTASLLRTATLVIGTSVGNRNVTMTGTAIAAAVLAQASIDSPTDFGRRRIGEPRTQTVRVTNTGAANLNITSLVFTGPFSGDRGTCNVAIAAGATCRINVTFTPGAPIGVKAGTVRLVSNASNTNVTASLTGESRAAAVAVAALRIVQPPATTSLRPVNVSLRVSTAATVRVQVRKPNGKLVWSKVSKVTKAGASNVRWNLRDSKGKKVKKGSYRFTITVTDASGAKVVMKKSVRVR